MATIGAKNGKARFGGVDLPHVRDWQLTTSANVKPYASSSTGGGMSRLAGQKDATGRITLYLDAASELYDTLREGDSGTFDLFYNGSLYWSGSFIVESITTGAPIENGDVVPIEIAIGQTANITAPA